MGEFAVVIRTLMNSYLYITSSYVRKKIFDGLASFPGVHFRFHLFLKTGVGLCSYWRGKGKAEEGGGAGVCVCGGEV